MVKICQIIAGKQLPIQEYRDGVIQLETPAGNVTVSVTDGAVSVPCIFTAKLWCYPKVAVSTDPKKVSGFAVRPWLVSEFLLAPLGSFLKDFSYRFSAFGLGLELSIPGWGEILITYC